MKIEIFNEIFGVYHNTVHHILKESTGKRLSTKEFQCLIKEISDNCGVSETTFLAIEKALKTPAKTNTLNQKDTWPFFEVENIQELRNTISGRQTETSFKVSRLNKISDIPLTRVEKMWLKTMFSDPRIKLFCDMIPSFLDNVEPLFEWSDYVLFDQYADGDSFQDKQYVDIFRKILKGVQNQSRLKIVHKKKNTSVIYNDYNLISSTSDRSTDLQYIDPEYIEYSERDNRFRLVGINPKYGRSIINIASIISCEEAAHYDTYCEVENKGGNYFDKLRKVVIELTNDNNILERALLHFSHYDKEAEYIIKGKIYRITITYDETDESDIIIRILSFGPKVRVVEPEAFLEKVRQRLKQQILLTD